MSGFSPDWLALREPVDHRSRDRGLAAKLQQHFAPRSSIEIVDLGCGTGSNLRGTFAMLPAKQSWTLVDYDTRLLAAARERLAAWGGVPSEGEAPLVVQKAGKHLSIAFREADLNRELERALGERPDLVTASAFFDLCSGSFIDDFAAAVAVRKAVFYTVLTYNGEQRWMPEHSADEALRHFFCMHQTSDKGFGPAAGPDAPVALEAAFIDADYRIADANSPWVLGEADRQLIADLATGYADAVAETDMVQAPTLAAWRRISRTGAIVGHTDTLALPPSRNPV